jgi:uncharacterized protein YbaR (Trm112 family)
MLDDEFLKNLHHVLLEVRLPLTYKSFIVLRMLQIHIEEGSMTCPNCKHVYPISNGIPNMVRLEYLSGWSRQHWVLAIGRTRNRLKLAFHKNELVHQVQAKACILFTAGRRYISPESICHSS